MALDIYDRCFAVVVKKGLYILLSSREILGPHPIDQLVQRLPIFVDYDFWLIPVVSIA
jgi:hypothetical protein